mmetsp:Transcript_36245/g.55672  ORF Transcript_36245/g.55672 Transcript_36245/m.55672 type:complete len:131 (-) Transcript_36245:276-668(-)
MQCSHQEGIAAEVERRQAMRQLFEDLEDIDSDDKEPMLILNYLDLGIKFCILKSITRDTFIKVFFDIRDFSERLPNLYSFLMGQIHDLMEEDNAFGQKQSNIDFYSNELKQVVDVDVDKAKAYFARPAAS